MRALLSAAACGLGAGGFLFIMMGLPTLGIWLLTGAALSIAAWLSVALWRGRRDGR